MWWNSARGSVASLDGGPLGLRAAREKAKGEAAPYALAPVRVEEDEEDGRLALPLARDFGGILTTR
jgi:hypothetical protein